MLSKYMKDMEQIKRMKDISKITGKKIKLQRKTLHSVLSMVKNTKQEEIDCSACFQEMEKYAESQLAGKALSEALVLVEQHLNNCMDCHEEYTLLLKALKKAGSF